MTTRRPTFSAALAAGLAAVLTLSPGLARAEAVPDFDTSLAGNYLAARLASTERDQDAAVVYLRNLMKLDARNEEILERTFFAMLMDGQIDDAMKLADRLVKIDRTHRVARLALAVRSIKKGHYQTARTNLALSVRGPIGDLTATLLAAWTFFGSGNTKGAVELIDRLEGPDWYAPMKELHAGLILDAAGQKKEAGRRLEAAMKADPGSLRAIDAYARWASRNDNTEAALAAYAAFDKQLPNHPIVLAAIKELKAGKQLPPLVKTAQEGSSEVLYGLGATLGRQGGEDLALVYLQLAIWLYPEHPFASLTLADLYEQLKQPSRSTRPCRTPRPSSATRRCSSRSTSTRRTTTRKLARSWRR